MRLALLTGWFAIWFTTLGAAPAPSTATDSTESPPSSLGPIGPRLELADKHGVESISFPAIGMGVYGYPPDRAAEIAIRTVRDYLHLADISVREVIFVLFGKKAYDVFDRALGGE